ncbi:MAG: hypothetical protein KAS32_24770, partial [Candidatus Peribacteraceae bacterium]|nr:hypothetical protein [Candidatus Peribacteraceae bacterium]
LDFQWFYWQRFGVNCGLMIPHRHGTDLSNLRVHIAGSYVLPFKHVTNTSIFIGYNTRKSWVTGVRLKF